MSQGSGGRLLVGFVVLHVLCCGALLLGGAGLLAAAGGLLGQPLLIAGGALLLVVTIGLAVRRARATSGSGCATTSCEVQSREQATSDRV